MRPWTYRQDTYPELHALTPPTGPIFRITVPALAQPHQLEEQWCLALLERRP